MLNKGIYSGAELAKALSSSLLDRCLFLSGDSMKKRQCTKCKKVKLLSKFYLRKSGVYKGEYYPWCSTCQKKKRQEYFSVSWHRTLKNIKHRCSYKGKECKRYSGRGIKCLITHDELKRLWFRDKAYLMKHPSIDRIDNDGNYTIKNCRYIEIGENSRRAIRKCKSVKQLSFNGKLIKTWASMACAGRVLNVSVQNISSVCLGSRKTTGGFKWEYAKKGGAF